MRNYSVSEIVSTLGLYHAKPTDWMKTTKNDIKKHMKHIQKH
jgi:hypothetical protein